MVNLKLKYVFCAAKTSFYSVQNFFFFNFLYYKITKDNLEVKLRSNKCGLKNKINNHFIDFIDY